MSQHRLSLGIFLGLCLLYVLPSWGSHTSDDDSDDGYYLSGRIPRPHSDNSLSNDSGAESDDNDSDREDPPLGVVGMAVVFGHDNPEDDQWDERFRDLVSAQDENIRDAFFHAIQYGALPLGFDATRLPASMLDCLHAQGHVPHNADTFDDIDMAAAQAASRDALIRQSIQDVGPQLPVLWQQWLALQGQGHEPLTPHNEDEYKAYLPQQVLSWFVQGYTQEQQVHAQLEADNQLLDMAEQAAQGDGIQGAFAQQGNAQGFAEDAPLSPQQHADHDIGTWVSGAPLGPDFDQYEDLWPPVQAILPPGLSPDMETFFHRGTMLMADLLTHITVLQALQANAQQMLADPLVHEDDEGNAIPMDADD